QAVRMPGPPLNPPVREQMPGDYIEIAASGGDNDRAIEGASEQNGRDAVRIKIVGIDQIEVMAVPDLPAQKRQDCGVKGERSYAHSRPWGIRDSADARHAARGGSPRLASAQTRHTARTGRTRTGSRGKARQHGR